MVRINLTVDEWTDKMLKLIAIEYNISRSEVVRNLVKAKVKTDTGILKGYCDIINIDEY